MVQKLLLPAGVAGIFFLVSKCLPFWDPLSPASLMWCLPKACSRSWFNACDIDLLAAHEDKRSINVHWQKKCVFYTTKRCTTFGSSKTSKTWYILHPLNFQQKLLLELNQLELVCSSIHDHILNVSISYHRTAGKFCLVKGGQNSWSG